MNRLATIRSPRRTGALYVVLDHLSDRADGKTHTTETRKTNNGLEHHEVPTEYGSALEMLGNPREWGATEIADALTEIATEDGLGVRVGEKAIRDYRRMM